MTFRIGAFQRCLLFDMPRGSFFCSAALNFSEPFVRLGLAVAQKSGIFIVFSKQLNGPVLVYIGIAVNTAVRAGVVGTDVGAFRAAAFFPCGFNFIRKSPGKE